jgi:hypothetical protein
MLTIQNIDKLIGHQFSNGWEVVDILLHYNQKIYSIQLGRFVTIYDPMTFTPHKKLTENGAIFLERTQKNGGYKMWNSRSTLSHLAMDISLMDTMDKLIKAIEFIL